nr:TSUP family transporter [Bacillus subtilis]
MSFVILVVLGLIAGTVGSLIGLGGGIVIVPSLMFLSTVTQLFQDVTPQVAIGTSLLVIIFTAFLQLWLILNIKQLIIRAGSFSLSVQVPAKMIGAYVSKLFNSNSFSVWFGIFMILISLSLMLKAKALTNQQSAQRNYPDISG